MVGGTMFHRRVIQREISRVLVLNLSGKTSGAKNTDRIFLSLTPPSLLSRGTLRGGRAMQRWATRLFQGGARGRGDPHFKTTSRATERSVRPTGAMPGS